MSRRDDVLHKVLSRVLFVENPAMGTPCWLWQGPTSGNGYRGGEAYKKGRGHGYGRMSLDGQTVAVHIVMWTHYNGYLPGKRQLDHMCGNRRCCNPAHLDNVTHLRNQRRRAAAKKGLKRVPGYPGAWYDPKAMTQEQAVALAAAPRSTP